MKNMIERVMVGIMLALCLGTGAAQEKITLTTPVYQSAGATEFRLASLYLNRKGQEIRAIFGEVQPGTATFLPEGRTLICRYDGAEAVTLLVALNKANLSTNSLERRVTTQCQTDGRLGSGTISGVPE